MQNDILELIKKEYKRKLTTRDEYNELIKKIKDLQAQQSIREYLKLTDREKDYERYSYDTSLDEDILFSSFMKYISCINIEDTNDIYILMKKGMENGKMVSVYWNIEQISPITLPIEETEEFEENHIIIFPKLGNYDVMDVIRIQKDFIGKAVLSNQQKAKKLVVRRYKNSK